tara:strand:- start:1536 stop:2843 length:1308 start_codon:yes stop_codon:yes gene_type:complete
MKVNSIRIKRWIDPELIAHFLASRFGEKGLSWLDSNGIENGEYSFLGVNPIKIISLNNNTFENPFKSLKQLDKGFWMGWLSYEAGSWIEPNELWQKSEIATLWIASYDPIIKFNLLQKEITLEGININKLKKYQTIINEIDIKTIKDSLNKTLIFDFSKLDLDEKNKKFRDNVIKIKNLIRKGDIFQANITTKVELEASQDYRYLDIYSKIRRKLKAPFGGIIVGDIKGEKEGVLSTSPERFLKTSHDGYVETRPIKGTRPRDPNKQKDALNAIDLITNQKDRAENIMIVDLLRNDLGKVCEIGSVKVTELLKLESYIRVHHLTSVIRGKIQKNKNCIDVLKACWPGGSVTGAPKIRACQRIYELEGFDRGPYCGSFLKLDWNSELDSNILIRSFILKNRKIKIYAGCGIVNDSIPLIENEELNWKLLPLIDSLK